MLKIAVIMLKVMWKIAIIMLTNGRSNDGNAKNDVENRNNNAKNMMLKTKIIQRTC